MGIINKLFSSIFKEDKEEWNDDFTNESRYDEENDDDLSYQDDDVDEEGGVFSDEELNRFEKALERFYSRLSQREMEDEDLDEAIQKIQDDFFEHKIKDPSKALNAVYQQWRSTRVQREQRKGNNRAIIIEMLRKIDELTPEEKKSLTDYDCKYCVRHLKKKDKDAVTQIVRTWFENKTLDDAKYEVINEIYQTDLELYLGDLDKYYDSIQEVPLTQKEYNQRVTIIKNDSNIIYEYDDYSDYFQRYWQQSGNHPKPIVCNDLIVNRPCYLKAELELVSPHFHMGRRYFERDSFQKVTLYLFEDALEYISDVGHSILMFSDIVEISMNKWGFIESECRSLNYRKYNGYTVDDSEWPDPPMLEITRRNGNKTLLSYDYGEGKANLLIIRALIYYFRQINHQYA